MRTGFAVLLLLSSAAQAAASPARPPSNRAEAGRTAAGRALLGRALVGRAPSPEQQLRLVFLEGDGRAAVWQGGDDNALLDMGTIAGRGIGRAGGLRTVVRQRFRLRVEGRATVKRFVRVRASVQGHATGHRVRVDGVLLSSVPQLVDAAAPIGKAVIHTIEIEVPISAPPGALNDTIVWLVEEE